MSTQAATSVTALSPINLGNGNSALITPWPELVQVQVYENAKAASDEYLREAKYSYEDYESLRQQNPHVKLPELKKPPAPTKNPNSGPAGRLPPIAVSLTPNVRLARIYTMPVRPVEPPANQPKDVADNAQHAAGVAVGAAQAVGGGVLAAATVVSDSILQIGDLLTAGYYRDTGLVQSALQRQSSLGSAIERAAKHPIDTAAGVLNDLEAKRQQAEALRAAGDFYEAGKVSGAILADAYPGGGAAAGMVKRVPHGEQLPAGKHGTDGVAILKQLPPHVKYEGSDLLKRGDRRPPEDIFKDGFSARGENTNLGSHQGGANDTGYISTSTDASQAIKFAKDSAGANGQSYVYTIDSAGLHGIDMNASTNNPWFMNELEIAVPGKIPNSRIIYVQEVLPNGTLGEVMPNPNYRGEK